MRAELHFHLLPDVDDGPRDLEEALELARLAVADGTRLVTCTPHVHLVDIATVPHRVAELQAALRAARIPLDIRPGGEVTPGTALTAPELRTIAQGPPGRRWILLEAPLEPAPTAEEFFADVAGLQAQGYGVLVGHPERSETVLAQRTRLQALLQHGVRLQVNASSLVGAHGDRARRAGIELIRDGLVTALASDAHRPARPPRLTEALAILAGRGIDGGALADRGPAELLEHGIEGGRRAA
jgi:protein-tyrosine phosphatase